jgi:hypothetical protein
MIRDESRRYVSQRILVANRMPKRSVGLPAAYYFTDNYRIQ